MPKGIKGFVKGQKFSEQHQMKLSFSHLGKIPWNKGIHTGIKPWLGKNRSQETIEKMRHSKIGKKLSFEQRRKISEALKGRMPQNIASIHGSKTQEQRNK